MEWDYPILEEQLNKSLNSDEKTTVQTFAEYVCGFSVLIWLPSSYYLHAHPLLKGQLI